jgi:hypothetical protein
MLARPPASTSEESSMAISRLLPLGGIVFVVLLLVAIIGLGGDTPDTNASGAEVASFYDEQNVRQGLGAFVLAATAPFLLFFAASLAGLAWPTELASRVIWRRVLLGGSFILGAVIMGLALTHFALADAADQEVAPEAMQALNALDGNAWVSANAALGVMMLGAAGWLLGRVGAYGWLGWAALIFGIALFIPFADFVALILSLVWIIVVSVMLYREPTAPTGIDEPLVARG